MENLHASPCWKVNCSPFGYFPPKPSKTYFGVIIFQALYKADHVIERDFTKKLAKFVDLSRYPEDLEPLSEDFKFHQNKFETIHRHLDLGPDLYRVQEEVDFWITFRNRQLNPSIKIDKKTKRPVKLPNGADAIEVDMEGKFGPMMDYLDEELSNRRVPAPTRSLVEISVWYKTLN